MAETRVQIPTELQREVEQRVTAGHFADASSLVAAAIRYYLERHRDEDWQEYVSKEIAWSHRHVDG